MLAVDSTRPHPRAEQIVEAARKMLGVRFRPQGRGVAGLDCLGLALHVAASAGVLVKVDAFPLRGLSLGDAEFVLRQKGCVSRAGGVMFAGDLLLASPATRQVHLAIRSDLGLIEAHAAIGRVIERPTARDEVGHSAWLLPMGDV